MNILNYIPCQFVVWGLGTIGKTLVNSLNRKKVVAIIESNVELVGTYFGEIKIISFQEYLTKYKEYYIIITPTFNREIVFELNENGIIKYFKLNDCPTSCIPFDKISKREIFSIPINKEKIAVYGYNLYAIAVLFFLKKHNDNEVKLIKDKQDNLLLNNTIIRDFNLEQNIIADSEITREWTVYSCIYNEQKAISRFSNSVIDIFELKNGNVLRENTELIKFKDIHKGKQCYIVATGPSLREEDLQKLHDKRCICMSMNNIMPMLKKTEWRPQYYVVGDRGAINEWEESIKKLKVPVKFVSRFSQQFWDGYKDSSTYSFNGNFDKNDSVNSKYVKFSNDISKRVYLGWTVTYACIQIAMYMGFREIVLIGVDFSNAGHYSEEYYSNENLKEKYIVYDDRVKACYQRADEEAKIRGVKIYNATRGGYLEVFQRKKLEDIMSGFDVETYI